MFRHGIDLDNPGSGETPPLVLAFASQIKKSITPSNTIFAPQIAASLSSTVFSGSGDMEDIPYKETATPPMHLLTPHVEISLPGNSDMLNVIIGLQKTFYS